MPDVELSAPVADARAEDQGPEEGIALCLSGGGYRAMLFHLGAIWRLNHAGYLPKLDRVSSVSGGSITAGVLGTRWAKLAFDNEIATNFEDEVVSSVRKLAGTTIDVGAVLGGILGPGSINSRVVRSYDEVLFSAMTLQSLPDDTTGPRFIINATNLQTGVLWRFSRPYMADYQMGRVPYPDVTMAQAVAASSAFPPVLSPCVIEVDPSSYDAESRQWDLSSLQAQGRVYLSDGGVYDNLGLETAWKRYKTILISDGGGRMAAAEKIDRDWPRHSLRVLKVIDNQVRSLRKRQALAAFVRGDRSGTYWGIGSHPSDFGLSDPLPTDPGVVTGLAATKTRLKKMGAGDQERLINWGYAICDMALRRWVEPSLSRPADVPYPSSPIH